jgi:hypothetical protein
MRTIRIIAAGLLIVGYSSLAGCTTLADDSAQADQAEIDGQKLGASRPDGNGIATRKLTVAALFTSKSIASQMVSHSLKGLESKTGIVYNEVCNADHNSHDSFRYLVKCALAKGHNIAINCAHYGNETVTGELGLADNWYTGTCGADCQQWVSACLLAHSSLASEIGVPIQLGGSNGAMTAGHDLSYPNDEGAYWGDLFNDDGTGTKRYGCAGTNASVLYSSPQMGRVKLMSRTCAYYDSTGKCEYCKDTADDTGNTCKSAPAGHYLLNLDLANSAKAKACTSLCSTDAKANGWYFNGCGSTTGSSRAITVWRK